MLHLLGCLVLDKWSRGIIRLHFTNIVFVSSLRGIVMLVEVMETPCLSS